jgi:hypothetical protein
MLKLLYFILIPELEYFKLFTPVNVSITTFLFYTMYTL